VGRGYETLKPNASPGVGLETGDRQYEGFDYVKAKTWATMCFALGGHFNWSDQPSGVKMRYGILRLPWHNTVPECRVFLSI